MRERDSQLRKEAPESIRGDNPRIVVQSREELITHWALVWAPLRGEEKSGLN